MNRLTDAQYRHAVKCLRSAMPTGSTLDEYWNRTTKGLVRRATLEVEVQHAFSAHEEALKVVTGLFKVAATTGCAMNVFPRTTGCSIVLTAFCDEEVAP